MPLLLFAYLAVIGVGMPEGMLGVAWPQMRGDFDAPVSAVGLLLLAGTSGYVFASVTAGFTLDRIGVGWLLAASTGLAGAALAGIGLAPTLLAVVTVALALGLGHGAIDTGLNAYVARNYGARHISWLHAGFGFGATIGPLMMTGVIVAGLVWRWAYAGQAALMLALALAFLVTARAWTGPPAPRLSPAPVLATTPPGWRTLALPGLWLGSAAFAVQVAIEMAAGLWAYTLLTTSRGVAVPLAGTAVSAYWGAMFVGRLLSGALTDRIGVHRVLAFGVAGMGVGAVLVALPAPGWLAVAGLVLIGFAGAPMFPLLMLTTAERVGQVHADRTIGVQIGASAVGGALLPAGIGVLIGRVSPEVLGPCLVVLALLLAIVYAWSRRVRAAPARSPEPV